MIYYMAVKNMMESRVGPNKITRDPCGDDGDGHGTDPDPLARQNVTGCATPRARQTLRQSLRQSCAKVCAKIFLGKRPLPLKVTLLTWIVTLLRWKRATNQTIPFPPDI